MKTMAEEDQTTFATAVADEFPYGSWLVGIVLDLTLNHKTWKKNPYLYACLLGWNDGSYSLRDTAFRICMELWLYICVTKVVQDKDLLDQVCRVFRIDQCTLRLTWKLHKLDFDSDGEAVRKMEGAGGTIDYHIVAIVKGDSGNAQYDLGYRYVYHTTHWGQNTYPSDRKLSPCTHALVVPGYIKHLIEPVRSAVRKSWLELSKRKCGHPAYTYKSRLENHHAVVSAALSVGGASASTHSCGSPIDAASAGTNPRDWQFPSCPTTHHSLPSIAFSPSLISAGWCAYRNLQKK